MKRKMMAMVVAATVAFVLTGCETTTPRGSKPVSASTNATPALGWVNQSGLEKNVAMAKARKLEPGMTEDEVRALLGEPDETGAGTYGTSTAHPWNGKKWEYVWVAFFRRFALSILFEKQGSSWVVNSWNWYEQPM